MVAKKTDNCILSETKFLQRSHNLADGIVDHADLPKGLGDDIFAAASPVTKGNVQRLEGAPDSYSSHNRATGGIASYWAHEMKPATPYLPADTCRNTYLVV